MGLGINNASHRPDFWSFLKPLLLASFFLGSVATQSGLASVTAYVPDSRCPFDKNLTGKRTKDIIKTVSDLLASVPAECKKVAAPANALQTMLDSQRVEIDHRIEEIPNLTLRGYIEVKPDCENYEDVLEAEYRKVVTHLNLALEPPPDPSYQTCFCKPGTPGCDRMNCAAKIHESKVSDMTNDCARARSKAKEASKERLNAVGIAKMGELFEKMIEEVDRCLGETKSEQVKKSLLLSTMQVASVLSAFEPTSGAAAMAAAVGTRLITLLVQKISTRNKPIDSGLFKDEAEYEAWSCAYHQVLTTPEILDCNAGHPFPASGPGNAKSGDPRLADYIFGENDPKTPSNMRKLGAVLEGFAGKDPVKLVDSPEGEVLLNQLAEVLNHNVKAPLPTGGTETVSMRTHLAHMASTFHDAYQRTPGKVPKETLSRLETEPGSALAFGRAANRINDFLKVYDTFHPVKREGSDVPSVEQHTERAIQLIENIQNGSKKPPQKKSTKPKSKDTPTEAPSAPLDFDISGLTEKFVDVCTGSPAAYQTYRKWEASRLGGKTPKEFFAARYGNEAIENQEKPAFAGVAIEKGDNEESQAPIELAYSVLLTSAKPVFSNQLDTLVGRLKDNQRGNILEEKTERPLGGLLQHVTGPLSGQRAPQQTSAGPITAEEERDRLKFFRGNILPLLKTCAYQASAFISADAEVSGKKSNYHLVKRSYFQANRRQRKIWDGYENSCARFSCELPVFRWKDYPAGPDDEEAEANEVKRVSKEQCRILHGYGDMKEKLQSDYLRCRKICPKPDDPCLSNALPSSSPAPTIPLPATRRSIENNARRNSATIRR